MAVKVELAQTRELIELQHAFTQTVAKLCDEAEDKGYCIVLKEALRSDEQAEINAIGQGGRERVAAAIAHEYPDLASALRNNGKAFGIRKSIHRHSLAVDVALYRIEGGELYYCDKTEEYASLGEWWEKQHDRARWGGKFRDGNHFSFEWNGIK